MMNFKYIVYSFFEIITWTYRRISKERFFYPSICHHTENKPIAILGNGDSLRNFSSDCNSQEMDFCLVNFSPLSDLFFNLRPKYFVLADDSFFDIGKVYDRDVCKSILLLSKALLNVSWKMRLLAPYVYYSEAKSKYGVNKNIEIVPFSRNSFSDTFCFHKFEYLLFSKGIASPELSNVGVAAIFNLVNSGYRTIYLYGMEHSWIKLLSVDIDNFVCIDEKHYYDKENKPRERIFLNGRPERIYEQLRFQAMTFSAYWVIKGYIESIGGINVINKTKGSYIDAFKKEL